MAFGESNGLSERSKSKGAPTYLIFTCAPSAIRLAAIRLAHGFRRVEWPERAKQPEGRTELFDLYLRAFSRLFDGRERLACDPVDEDGSDDQVRDRTAHQRPPHDQLVLDDHGGAAALRGEGPRHPHTGGDAFDVLEHQPVGGRLALLHRRPPRRPTAVAPGHLETEPVRRPPQDAAPPQGAGQRRPPFHIRRQGINRPREAIPQGPW